uniref:C3/C5 convertase n=1 Tax=Hadrurus spadix TaxID=141984 RepID=A0A1W7RA24_9SCOR
MGAIYFRLGVCFLLMAVINHHKIECQNITSLSDYIWINDLCENCTSETEFDSTTLTVPLPTKKPKKRNRDSLECPSLPVHRLQNGNIRMLSYKKFRYICNEGFRLIGPTFIRCNRGRWDNIIKPKCIPPLYSCNPPEPISNGIIIGNERLDGSRILYICDQGYELLGSRERTCKYGYWSPDTPSCEDKYEPLKSMATRFKHHVIDEVGSYSSNSHGRSIGSDIKEKGLELLLLIDRSSSIDPVDFKKGINFVKVLIDEFGVDNSIDAESTGTRIAVITFGDTAKLVIKPNDASIKTKHDAYGRLDALQPGGGGTAMHQAFATLITIIPLLRPKAKKAVFLITDGRNNVGNINISDMLKPEGQLKTGMEIFAVGIGQDIDKDELTKIASEPTRNHLFLLDSFSDLESILSLIKGMPTKAPPLGKEKCGVITKNSPEAIPGWPWLAVIYVKHARKENQKTSRMGICSGSLICSQWVLTSASCFYGEDETIQTSKINAFVTLGEDDLSKEEEKEKNFRVSKIKMHPKFRPWSGNDYDIALVKLTQPAPLDFTYRPVCLPERNKIIHMNDDTNEVMAGWGSVPSSSFFDNNFASAFSIFPEITTMPIVDDTACSRIKETNHTNAFCAGSRLRRTCSGNLGSPLVAKDVSNIHYLVGVLSSKKYCQSYYNVFSEILQYTSWIRNTTNRCQDVHSVP